MSGFTIDEKIEYDKRYCDGLLWLLPNALVASILYGNGEAVTRPAIRAFVIDRRLGDSPSDDEITREVEAIKSAFASEWEECLPELEKRYSQDASGWVWVWNFRIMKQGDILRWYAGYMIRKTMEQVLRL
jgi:hypothetical protein